MPRNMLRSALSTLLGLAVLAASSAWISSVTLAAEPNAEVKTTTTPAAARPAFTPEQEQFFEREVQPILAGKCLKCHGGEEKVASGFFITSRAAVLRGGELGPGVDLQKPNESQLLQAVRYEGLEMPPSGKLSAHEVDVLTRWVSAGLPWPVKLEREPPSASEPKKKTITAEDRSFWAYSPVVEPAVPSVKNSAWVRNPIDAFILAKLEAEDLSPSVEVDPRTLMRRATYDLVGLPPTVEEVAEFARAKDRDQAYGVLLDRLLASPHYGEKWGRHWLDLVRYAETHGYERDSAKPAAWRYRDYVVNAFNADKPYDQFLREQLAGDEQPNPSVEALTATGFYRLGIWDDEPADRELAVFDELDGIAATTSSVVLGMSVGCARCHDHKRDPILQRDYYRLLACFRDVAPMNRENLRRVATEETRQSYESRVAEKRNREADWYTQIYGIEQRFLAEAAKRGKSLGSILGADLTDLKYKFYRDTWNSLPDFDSLKPETVGEVAARRISLEPATRSESIGLVFEGKLLVPTTGEYEFSASVREGFRLILDGKPIINEPNRGYHNVAGKAQLTAGAVAFRFEYFNAAQAPRLNLFWSGPSFKMRPLSDGVPPAKPNEPDVWSYTTAKPDAKWIEPGFDDSKWKHGPSGFGTPGTPGSSVATIWDTKEIYLRRKFTLNEVPERLALDLHHDEDVVIYLNGREAYAAKGFLKAYEQVVLDRKTTELLKPGENVIAVSCKQSSGGQFIDVRISSAAQTLHELVRQDGASLLGPAELKKYAKLTEQLEKSRREPLEAPGLDVMSVREQGIRPTHILLRGLPQAKGDVVTAGAPEVLESTDFALPAAVPSGDSSGKRTALALWLTDPRNPMTARVMVNRLWQYHFGRGLVASSNDFGKLGELPSHPELLDWLAAEFVRSGWSMKHMHRLMMMSATYRQASSALVVDPDNRLWGRMTARRLTAEEVRDSFLAVSGKLDLRVGGESVQPPIPKEVLAGQSRPGEGWPTSSPADANRRSIYVRVKRSLQLPILATHDQADTDASCAVRYVTTVPTQALGLINGEFAREQGVALAERLQREVGDGVAERVRRAWQLTAQREPTPDEIRRDVEFIVQLQQADGLQPAAAWNLYCLMCLNTNEFLYVD